MERSWRSFQRFNSARMLAATGSARAAYPFLGEMHVEGQLQLFSRGRTKAYRSSMGMRFLHHLSGKRVVAHGVGRDTRRWIELAFGAGGHGVVEAQIRRARRCRF